MVQIPREIYTLGAVQFDTRQLANLEGQLLAKKEAKEKAEQEAIDKYMADLGGKLTPTGVRTNDLRGFEQRRKQWMEFGLQNKGKLKDPTVRAEFDRLYNNALTYVQASKNADEEIKPARTMLIDPTKRKELNTDAVISDVALHDLALDDPRRKKVDYNAAWYKPSTFDFTKEFSEASKGQPKSFLRVVPDSRNLTLGTVSTEEGWTPKSITAIADNFTRSVRDNPDKYEYYVRRAKSYTPAELIDLNKELIGTGVIADNHNPLAVAYAEAIRQAKSAVDVIQRPDTELAQQRGVEKAIAGKTVTGEGPYYDYWGEALSKPIKEIGSPEKEKDEKTGKYIYKYPRIQGRLLNSLSPTAQERIINIANAISPADEKYGQKDLILTEDEEGGIHIEALVLKDELNVKGKPTGKQFPIGTREITPITSIDLNLKPQINVATRGQAVLQAKEEKGKSYNINGKSFTKAQLEAGAKKYKMNFSEYLKSLGINE